MSISQILVDRWILVKHTGSRCKVPEEDIPKISDLIKELINSNSNHVLFMDSLYPHSKIAEEALYIYCTNPEVRKIFKWGTNKICSTIKIDNYLTVHVYLRIITGMLNKTNIPKEINMYYHDNLAANVASLLSELSVEDLPF